MMRKLYISYPEDDLIEGPFMRKLGFEICDAPDWMDDKLRRYAMEWWGLTEEDVGLTKDEEGE
jgi:hypothetical protein